MFEITDVFKSFSDKDVLRGASLSVKNKSAALMGESGSGKTTILRIIASLEKVDSGNIGISGKTAVAFSEPRLFDKFRVMENVTCVMPKTMSKAEKEARARVLLTDLLLDGAERMTIYLPNEQALNEFLMDYFWGHFSGNLATR